MTIWTLKWRLWAFKNDSFGPKPEACIFKMKVSALSRWRGISLGWGQRSRAGPDPGGGVSPRGPGALPCPPIARGDPSHPSHHGVTTSGWCKEQPGQPWPHHHAGLCPRCPTTLGQGLGRAVGGEHRGSWGHWG